ncbi:MAG: hypothetical protein VYE77_10140, partial [Planctomycetota bacterium]|nr:hypothetical protein [Planctomycetota bacterium]
YLEDRPIAARRQSTRELFVYWCRRNRALATVGAVALFAVVSAAVVGWTAYLMTQDALERAEASSKSEALARDRADDNVAVALEAFEDVFDSLVGPDPLHALLAEVEEVEDEDLPDAVVALRAPVEVEDVALLQRILEFYDRYAVNNADSADLQGQAARAYRRVGAIQARLGDLAAATNAYEKSAQLYRDTHEREAVRDLAAVLQELGEVQVRRGLSRDAASSFTKSLRVLDTDLSNPGRSGRWLTARAHYMLATVHSVRPGSRRPGGSREGGRREGRSDERREGGRREGRPDERREGGRREGRPDERREGGRREGRPDERREGGRREDRSGDRRGRDGSRRGGRSGRPSPRPQGEGGSRPRFERSRTLAREHLQQARELLDGLLREQPEDSECLFLSARCLLAAVRVRSRSSGESGLEEIDKAIAILEGLVERFPSADVYRFELCMALVNKGRMPRNRSSEGILEAVQMHSAELVAQQPEHPEYRSLQGRVFRDQAMRLSRTNSEEAIKLLRASLAIQEELAEEQDQRSRFLESVILTRQHLAALLLAAEQNDAAREEFALTLEQAKKLAEQGRLPRPMTGRLFALLAERLGLQAEFQELREMQGRRGR